MIAHLRFWWAFTGIVLVFGLFYKFKDWLLEYARNNTLQLLIWVAVLIGVLLIVMLIVFLLGRKKPKLEAAAEDVAEADEDEAEEPEKEPEEAPAAVAKVAAFGKLSALRLRKICSRAMKRMKANVPGKKYRYQIPWIMMLGEAGAGKTRSLEQARFKMPLGGPVGGRSGERDECKWWFFEKGIVIDVSGDLVLQEDGFSSNGNSGGFSCACCRNTAPSAP